MIDFGLILKIAIGSIFINNYVLARFLGICPFVGVSKKVDSAMGMGMAVIFVMTMASMVTYLIYYFILIPLDIVYLQTISFILVIATFVQLVEMVLQKMVPSLYQTLGIFLPLITTNCAILGVALLNIQEGYSFIDSIVNGIAAGIGFTIALVLMAGMREKLEYAKLPKSVEGLPLTFIIAGLMSMAFLGFSGLSIDKLLG